MAFYVINSYDDLETGIWGIREPRTSLPRFENMQELTLILVPGLAFDRQGEGWDMAEVIMTVLSIR
ncbi:5-formyltetrahydrofolate cyclo-ligase [Paenibacillus larvae]|nr:5-formyltetrahydrofolate cyclo-ligase [Paenibacillus larvae]MDT2239450.1 5-formyltetrahydrofolate cyclo-ligase [Paenibacillus larvae]